MAAGPVILFVTGHDPKLGKMQMVMQGLDPQVTVLADTDLPPAPALGPDALHRDVAQSDALHYSRHFDGLVMAADGGVSVPALGGPRVVRPASTREDACAQARDLLARLSGVPKGDRAILWVETLALARDGQLVASWDSAGPPGEIVEEIDCARITDPRRWQAVIWKTHHGRVIADLTHDEFMEIDVAWKPLRANVQDFFRRQSA